MAKRTPKDTNGAPASDTVKSMPVKVQELLIRLAGGRQSAKNRLETAIAARKDLDSELDQLGAGETDRHLRVRSKMVVTLRQIKWYRARIKTVGDKIDELLLDPTQDLLSFDMPNLDQRDPDEAVLFHAEGGGDQAEPVGTQAEFGDETDDDEDEDDEAEDSTEDAGAAAEGEDETVGSKAEATSQQLRAMLPGMFADQNGRQLPIGDIAALEECVNNAVGAVWFMDIIDSEVYGKSINVRKEPGDSSPVVFSLSRVGDVPAPRMAGGGTSSKKAAKKPASKKSSKKATSKKKSSKTSSKKAAAK